MTTKQGGLRGSLNNIGGGVGVPNIGALRSQYDATKLTLSAGNTIDPFPDERGVTDLAATNTPNYETDVINGNPVSRYNGTDENHNATFASVAQPFVYAFAFNVRSVDSGAFEFYVGEQSNDGGVRILNSQGEWQIGDSGNSYKGGTVSTGEHIIVGIFDGTNSKLRVDGTDVATGELSDSVSGIALSERGGGGNNSAMDMGEFLFYDGRPNTSDVESYLNDKWGMTITL